MKSKQLTKREVILQEWRRLKTDLVGSNELKGINEALLKVFGPGGAESPASLARLLADHGARLKHPEVLETDTRWREQRLDLLFAHGEIDFNKIASSIESISKMDDLYRQFLAEGDDAGLEQVREFAKELKFELRRSTSTALTAEVGEWLTIWLQTPQMFAEWLDLRIKSPGFQAKFGSEL
ncbi:MAG TPA: hypothetical protein VFH91_05785 [Pyrinomonadaceae bacterium]|nr:hypothetical protein [Pyrinomonadaceae bacterium]